MLCRRTHSCTNYNKQLGIFYRLREVFSVCFSVILFISDYISNVNIHGITLLYKKYLKEFRRQTLRQIH